MNNLHRELAPISDAAWKQIEEEVTRTFQRNLAGRRSVDVEMAESGVKRSAIGTGHLRPLPAPQEGVVARQRVVMPLVEFRVPFELTREAIDDVERGAEDSDWQPAKDAKPGETVRFKHGVKLDLDKMTGIMPIVFLAPGGDFEKRTKFETLPVIPIKATPEVLAKLEEDAKRAAARAAAVARPASATLKRSRLSIAPEGKTVTKGD